ncbi:broad-spectrum mercury transporter MerE [Saccharospirillum salsuginis]|uniref:Mercury resistance protein n=1 Tax=Saccharospirillum salsuginis TaxID=418750 RepID=A0A918KQN3_9GAMM|nr:broad-spectrum mercury transporter MerE [Saccharospirillum salsuginis]GGX70797.1 mercury resistance protein [Saccharospirillum salsuginis]
MNKPARPSSVDKQPSLGTYAWGVLAALTCPCHLPLVALALAGTSFGAILMDYILVAAGLLVALFGLSLYMAMSRSR